METKKRRRGGPPTRSQPVRTASTSVRPPITAVPPTPPTTSPSRTTARTPSFHSLSPSPSFDLIVVGCGGGPGEDDLSSYFVKARTRRWEEGYVGVEAGSGLAAVRRMLDWEAVVPTNSRPVRTAGRGKAGKGKGKEVVGTRGKGGPFIEFEAVASSSSARMASTSSTSTTTTVGAQAASSSAGVATTEEPTAMMTVEHASTVANDIFAPLNSVLVSHAHFDHIASLVLSAGSLPSCPKQVWGIKHTCDNVIKVFDGGVWPQLASRQHHPNLPLWIRELPLEQDEETPIGPSLTVRARRVAHGTRPSTPCAFPTPPDVPEVPYESTAFFITSSPSSATQEGGVGRGREGSKQFLFFGDVGPDSVSGLDWNRRVWGEAAALLSQGVLDTVFIECSYPAERKKEMLYGHLSPPFLFEELAVLASMCPPSKSTGLADGQEAFVGRLEGLSIVVIHVKDDLRPPPSSGEEGEAGDVRDKIAREIGELEERARFGCRFVVARQGDRFEF